MAHKEIPQTLPAADFTSFNNRLRLIEEKVTNLNKKAEVLESNLLTNYKKTNTQIKTLDTDILELKRDLDQIKDKISLIVKELKMTAGKDELNTIKKYLDLWNPTRFATHQEVEKVIKEKIEEKSL